MSNKLYVHCFQDLKIKGQERPYLAEFIEQIGKHASTARCLIKIGRATYTVHRQACSEKPFTMEDLKRVQLESTPKPAKPGRGRAGSVGQSSERPVVKIEGSYW